MFSVDKDWGRVCKLLRWPAESAGVGCSPGFFWSERELRLLSSSLLVDLCPLVLEDLTHLLHALLQCSVQQQESQQHAVE